MRRSSGDGRRYSRGQHLLGKTAAIVDRTVVQFVGSRRRGADIRGLGLQEWHGRYEDMDNTWLRWMDKQGRPIPTGAERAEREEARAEREQRRANRLAEQLRRLGAEPEL